MIQTDGARTIAHYRGPVTSTREDLLELVSNVPDPVDVLAELLVRHDIDEGDVLDAQIGAWLDGAS